MSVSFIFINVSTLINQTTVANYHEMTYISLLSIRKHLIRLPMITIRKQRAIY